MAERPNNNKRQRSTSYRKDKDVSLSIDGHGDTNTTYVPFPFVIYMIHPLLIYTICILSDTLYSSTYYLICTRHTAALYPCAPSFF